MATSHDELLEAARQAVRYLNIDRNLVYEIQRVDPFAYYVVTWDERQHHLMRALIRLEKALEDESNDDFLEAHYSCLELAREGGS